MTKDLTTPIPIAFAHGPHHSLERAGYDVFTIANLFRVTYPGERLDTVGVRTPSNYKEL